MEFRQFNDGGCDDGGCHDGGGMMMGGHHGLDANDQCSDQWSNLKNNLIFVLESCI